MSNLTQLEAIKSELIGRLVPIFGKPANVEGLAESLAKHVPEWANAESLAGLADAIILKRKAKGFPSASELITFIRAIGKPGISADLSTWLDWRERERAEGREWPAKLAYMPEDIPPWHPQYEGHKADAWFKAQRLAVKLAREYGLAETAIRERWAPGLLDFIRSHGRLPNFEEQDEIVAKSRANDKDADEFGGMLRSMIVDLRNSMHASAERELTA